MKKTINIKRKVISAIFLVMVIILSATIVFSIKNNGSAFADTDGTSSAYGFTVDKNFYDISWKNNAGTIYVKVDGKQVGEVDISIGKAVSKQKFTDSQYLITYMVRAKTISKTATYTQYHRFLWLRWTSQYNKYGWFENVSMSANMSNGTKLFDSFPKYTASDTSYSLGANAGVSSSGPSAGISAGVSFTSKAIEITNNSNSSSNKVDIDIHHNVSWGIWDWGRFKYAQQENCQLFSFSVLSNSKTSTQTLKFSSTFGTSGSKINSWTDWGSIYVGSSAYGTSSTSIRF